MPYTPPTPDDWAEWADKCSAFKCQQQETQDRICCLTEKAVKKAFLKRSGDVPADNKEGLQSKLEDYLKREYESCENKGNVRKAVMLEGSLENAQDDPQKFGNRLYRDVWRQARDYVRWKTTNDKSSHQRKGYIGSEPMVIPVVNVSSPEFKDDLENAIGHAKKYESQHLEKYKQVAQWILDDQKFNDPSLDHLKINGLSSESSRSRVKIALEKELKSHMMKLENAGDNIELWMFVAMDQLCGGKKIQIYRDLSND